MTRSTLIRTLALLGATLTLIALPLAAAQDDASGNENGDAAAQEPRAALRFAHLAPEGPNITVVVDGEPVIDDLAPNTVSDYVFLEPGDRSVQVFRSGFGPAAPRDGDDGVDPAAGADDAAAPAQDPEARDDAVGAQDPPADGAAAPADPPGAGDPAVREDEPLLEHTATLQESSYGTLLLMGTGRQVDGQGGDAQQEAEREDDARQEDQQEQEADDQEQQDAEQEQAAEGGAVAEEPEGEDAAAEDAPGDGAAAAEADDEARARDRIELEARLIDDGVRELPGAGEANVRVVHGAPRTGPITVVAAHRPENGEQQDAEQQEADAEQQEGEQGEDEGPQPIQGDELASGLSGDDPGEYRTVPAGRHHLQVRDQDDRVAVDLEDMVFEAGLVYTLYVSATEDAEDLVITATVDAGVAAEDR